MERQEMDSKHTKDWSFKNIKGFSLSLCIILLLCSPIHAKWQPANGPLMTRWAERISPKNAHREYPRPQMVRKKWLNLNGLWDYAIVHKSQPQPDVFDGQILVPFPVESALSGVMKPIGRENRLWYRRTFRIPRTWKGRNVLLHFGAVDWETTVWVNGNELGTHRGGYDPFSLDITDALKQTSEQQIVVSVWDPTNAGTQPRGKQVDKPGGIWYTAVTGIWQTVWLEPVSEAYIKSIKITADIDNKSVRVTATCPSTGHTTADPADYSVEVEVKDGWFTKAKNKGKAGEEIVLNIKKPKLWSPDSPFLYDMKVTLKDEKRKKVDAVGSYFGFRKIEVRKDKEGINRLFLNNEPLFQFGPLDQGWWPEGLYTAPSDAALRYDIEVLKKLGYNMLRKHVKVEPARLYYWCDKLGLMVWQDMPNGDKHIGRRDPDLQRSPQSAQQFETELTAMISNLYNHPSIVMWVPYNEGWGQWDTPRIVNMINELDPTRLVNNASGWVDRGAGDVHDIHSYPGPAAPPAEEKRAGVLGEFGGLGLPVKGHTWQDENNWGYRSFETRKELTDAYIKLIDNLRSLIGDGLSAAVYTQTTDVEIEVNGLMTYDRQMVKIDVKKAAEANKRLYLQTLN
jgi:beta-galactosidase/beta-glucuronidase